MKRNREEELNRFIENITRACGSKFFSYNINADNAVVPTRNLGLFFNRLLAITEDLFKGVPLKKLRILDLGSYEGINSIPFAQLGAKVVSVEGREVNFTKMKFAKEYLGLKKLEVVQADVRTVTKEKYGEFDLVLACGIMYHLDAESVFTVAKNIFEMTKTAAIIDTHIALAIHGAHTYDGRTYSGIPHKEFEPDASAYTKKFSLANSLDNNESFWFTKISWLNLLKSLGWNNVYECFLPHVEGEKSYYDRATFVAVKNPRFKSFFQIPAQVDFLPEQIGKRVSTFQDQTKIPGDNGIIVR